MAIIASALVTACIADVGGAAVKGLEVDSTTEATLAGDGPPMRVGLDDARAMAAALARAVNDPDLLGRSKAPVELLKDLLRSVGEAEITSAGQLRAGDWLATSTEAGPRWEYRLSPPDPPRIGPMFRAPLVRDEQGWTVPAIQFVRLR